MNQKTFPLDESLIQAAILVINCGSSSVKFSLIDPNSGLSKLSGLAERLLTPQACIKINGLPTKNVLDNELLSQQLPEPYSHQKALSILVDTLQAHNLVKSIKAIGHRIVHGGEYYAKPVLIDETVKQTIDNLSRLAPLHNPANLIGINACQHAFASVPQIAVFDTAFHQTMPEKAYLYGLPYSLYQDHGIRRYGFHGTSHYFVAKQAAKLLEKPLSKCNLISVHLGNGCSVTAIKNGESVDTSMGMTPLEGVIMGTRSGDIDAGIIIHLMEKMDYTIEQVNTLLNKESGLLGLSTLSNDCRALESTMLDECHPQSERAKMALTVFCYRIAKSIASLSASLTQLDGLIFTGGIGENSSWVREQITKQLSLLNIYIDEEQNKAMRFGCSGNIATKSSRDCFVITTNEEWVIAEQSAQLLTQLSDKEK